MSHEWTLDSAVKEIERLRKELPTGWFHMLDPDFALKRGFPLEPHIGDKYTADDCSKWHFDGTQWELHDYAPKPIDLATELATLREQATLPALDSPEARRYAADVVAKVLFDDHGVAHTLRVQTDRAEAEARAETEREARIAKLTKVLEREWTTPKEFATALDDLGYRKSEVSS